MTQIKLINYNELAPNKEKTLSFNNITEQYQFFSALSDGLIDALEFQYLRDDAYIKAEIPFEEARQYNYVMYSNDGSKWNYAYVTSVRYVSPSVSQFNLELDVMQTYQFEYTLGESFIEREHQNRWVSDGQGGYINQYNTIDEGLEYGNDYEVRATEIIDENAPEYTNGTKHNLAWLYIYAKERITTGNESTSRYFGIDSNMYCYVAPILLQDGLVIGAPNYRVEDPIITDYPTLSSGDIAELSQNANVLAMSYSRTPPSSYQFDEDPSGTFKFIITPFGDFPVTASIPNVNGRAFHIGNITTDTTITTLSKPDFNVGSITINQNKSRFTEPKLYTSPYQFRKLNMYGNVFTIKYEHMDKPFNPDVEVVNSKILSLQFDEVSRVTNYLGGKGFPDSSKNNSLIANASNQLNLRTDAWNEYVARNKTSMNAGLVTAGAQAGLATVGALLAPATGGISLALAGVAVSSASQIGGQLAKRQDIKSTPDEIKDGAGDIMANKAIHKLYISIDEYEITSEYANILANYFYYYGYKANRYGTPNTRTRWYFNYLKTIDTRIESDLPLNIVERIKQVYENGVTIYHVRDINNFNVETQKENLETFLVP